MRLIESLKKKKFILFNIFLTLYIGINLVGGERGLISYYEKNKIQENLIEVEKKLSSNLEEFEKKNKLLSTNIDYDFIDIIYREKFKFGKKDEIIIKLK
tara:strand:- start:478 stop:774 length:297 start_codon:yes stop_codon:yes gene_type:complete